MKAATANSRRSLWALCILPILFHIAPALAASPLAVLGDRAPTAILRVMPSYAPPNQRLPEFAFIAGYEVIGQPVPLDAGQASALLAAVKAPDAFDDTEPEQRMMPGISYRFGAGADAIEMLVCFGCDKVAIIPPGADKISDTLHITQPTRDALLGLAKKLLPNDEAIQSLPKVRATKPVPPPSVPVPKDAPRAGGATASEGQ